MKLKKQKKKIIEVFADLEMFSWPCSLIKLTQRTRSRKNVMLRRADLLGFVEPLCSNVLFCCCGGGPHCSIGRLLIEVCIGLEDVCPFCVEYEVLPNNFRLLDADAGSGCSGDGDVTRPTELWKLGCLETWVSTERSRSTFHPHEWAVSSFFSGSAKFSVAFESAGEHGALAEMVGDSP